jgi:hypothetical protein
MPLITGLSSALERDPLRRPAISGFISAAAASPSWAPLKFLIKPGLGDEMPTWITKKSPISEWGGVQFRMIMAQQEMPSSLHLAMLVSPRAQGQLYDVVILLPDDSLRSQFPGFADISESDVPAGMKLLVGEASSFKKRFPEIAATLDQETSMRRTPAHDD